VAISVPWVVNNTVVTSTTTIYTVPTYSASSTIPYAQTPYVRDLVVTNGGPSTVFIGLGTGVTGGATVSSFAVPSGGTVILTQCQVPQGSVVGAISSGTAAVSVGFGTNVSYV
jgi:hypothetical protein